MRLVPVTDWAVKACVPVEWEEQHGTVVVVGEDVNDGVNHAAENKGQPSMPARVGFAHEAPEQEGVNKQSGRRMQKIVGGDPPGIVEISGMDDVLHHTAGVLLKDKTGVCQRSPRKQTKRNIGYNRTP